MTRDGEGQGGGEKPPMRPTVIVMGVSACGKSRVGSAVARRLGVSFVDGDDLHSAGSVGKMAAGVPLCDEDRWPWLDRIGDALRDRDAYPAGIVLACSALRKVYRDRIRQAVGDGLVILFLDVAVEEAQRRIAARRGHYMPPALLESQFRTLERPDGEADVETIQALDGVEFVAEAAARAVRDRETARLRSKPQAPVPAPIDPEGKQRDAAR